MMKPTCNLRFVERESLIVVDMHNYDKRTMKILQQEWIDEDFLFDEGKILRREWRDVPTVVEKPDVP